MMPNENICGHKSLYSAEHKRGFFVLLALKAFFYEMPHNVALDRVHFSGHDLFTENLTSSVEDDPATDLEQLLNRYCLFQLQSGIIQTVLNQIGWKFFNYSELLKAIGPHFILDISLE